jgi:hypothetical protein
LKFGIGSHVEGLQLFKGMQKRFTFKGVSGFLRLLLMRFLLEEGTRTTSIWGKWRWGKTSNKDFF